MKSVSDKLEFWPLERLKAYARNSRTHSQEQIAKVAASIQRFGFTNPILVTDDGGIVAGHGRLLAARLLEMATVPVIVVTGWTDDERRAYVIADNQLAIEAGWDEEILRLELGDLRDAGFDLALTGFDSDALAAILIVGPAGAPDPDLVPAAPANPVTVSGDLWALGNHRLICGDSRDAATVGRLIGKRRINLAFTSPPYASQRDYDASSGFRPIPPDEYVEWFAPVAANVAAHLADDGSWFVNIKPNAEGLDTSLYVFDLVTSHVRKWGWHFATEFCWERPGVPKGVTQRFKNAFEPIYQFVHNRWKMRPDAVRHESANVPRAGGPGVGHTSWAKTQGGNGQMFGAAKKRAHGSSGNQQKLQGSRLPDGSSGNNPGEFIGPGLAFPGNRLPTFSHTHEALGHAAAFPVGLPEFFCKAYTDKGDAVFEPFSGSGSTLIAAEITDRECFAIEISPAYVDVAIQRWQCYTGKTATLLASKQSFADVASARNAVAA